MSKEERTTSSTGGQKGTKLARFDLIPPRPLWLLAEHYGKGAKKYAEHQWRHGYEWGKSIASLERHLNLFKQGIDYDTCDHEPDNCLLEYEGKEWDGDPNTCWNHTGSHHMQAVMWMAFSLMEFIDDPKYKQHDDRYIPETEYLLQNALDAFKNYNPKPYVHCVPKGRVPFIGDFLTCCGERLERNLSFSSDVSEITCPKFRRDT